MCSRQDSQSSECKVWNWKSLRGRQAGLPLVKSGHPTRHRIHGERTVPGTTDMGGRKETLGGAHGHAQGSVSFLKEDVKVWASASIMEPRKERETSGREAGSACGSVAGSRGAGAWTQSLPPLTISLSALGHGLELSVPVPMAHLLYLAAGSWEAMPIS